MSSEHPEVSIESAVLADVDALADLWVSLARGQRTYDSHLLADENRTTIRESLAQHVVGDGVVVARATGEGDDEEDRVLVGFAMFGLEQGDYAQTVTRGIVHDLFVAPDRRGEGIGSALLVRAEEGLVEFGADAFALEAMATNADARRFYERHGYRPHRVELEKSAQSDTHSKEDG
ncbi:GNAT family N-acetyltransferase [Salinigranum rubrum]|uniref:GNAT family N-acetyltransferase n=1 Tax=Salinigranum rubrum TaxID=755307 RepID=A0A2I8VJW1_9EURY|nr:GNAT family N-acetyltransferase [Salinigranum rubrum]AUV82207.1 GNAT family N-acetyltransferase [Salinigranum rubrum]